MDGLPQGVLGYARSSSNDKILILLNFDDQKKGFQVVTGECIFRLTPGSQSNGSTVRLDAYGALILKQQK
jgi:hypothetical protein